MRNETFLDMRSPKSPRRFFSPFSPQKPTGQAVPPLPPLPPMPTMPLPPTPTANPYSTPRSSNRKSHTPNSSTSSTGGNMGLGSGATVVRRPSDALRGVQKPFPREATYPTPTHQESGTAKQSGSITKRSMEELWVPLTPSTPPLRHQKSEVRAPHRSQSDDAGAQYSRISMTSTKSVRHQSILPRKEEYRSVLKGSFSSLSSFAPSPSPPSSSAHLEPSRKKGHQSMSPSPRIQGGVEAMSAFDPFGLKDPPASLSEAKAKAIKQERRTTVRPPPRLALPPFHALLTSKSTRPAPTGKNEILVVLEFGYSLDDPPKNTSVTLPWVVLGSAGGHLVRFIKDNLTDEEEERCVSMAPEMTDGSSAEDSDLDSDSYDLNDLLRDEYLKSLFITSPSQPEFNLPHNPAASTTRPLKPVKAGLTTKKRAATRNQYTQLVQYPSPLSPYTSRPSVATRRHAPVLIIEAEKVNGGGTITELKVLLARDAAVYHLIAARLATGAWIKVESTRRKRLEDELRWLGMTGLEAELDAVKLKSAVWKGGEGYI